MAQDIWINLPVKDLEKSKTFFAALGVRFEEKYSHKDQSVALVIGDKNVVVMLFQDTILQQFAQHPIADTQQGTEVMFSISAETRGEVDEWARKVEAAGGNLFAKPTEIQGWMYGCAFADLDGHRWNILYMDKAI